MEPISLPDLLGLDTPFPYLAHLSSLTLPDLLAEPTRLKTQSHHLTSSLSALTQASYPTFLSLHQASASLDASLTTFSSSLDALLHSSLPNLDNALSAWTDRTLPVLRDRDRARLVLDQHDKLRDLLDIPLLIDTSVRNGYFDQALSLIAHANSLSSSSSSPILRSIHAEVHHSTTHMLLALLSTLHEPHQKLPALFKAVNLLRKMSVFETDAQLALAFLTGRESCLNAALTASHHDVQQYLVTLAHPTDRERDQVARYLRRHIDLWREGVHDIITQFTTIFLDPDKSSSSSTTTTTTILTTYASYALTTHLLPPLRTLLPLVPSALPSLLTQLTYCATAFARVGMDFRALLTDLFCDAVLNTITNDLHHATHNWSTRLKSTTLPPSQWLLSSSSSSSLNQILVSSPTTTVHIPPPTLASFPPLAEFLNALLTSFNALRLLAPVPIFPHLVHLLDTTLAHALSAFTTYAHAVTTTTSGSNKTDMASEGEMKEMRAVKALGDTYVGVFVPYVRRALVVGVYGAPDVTGVSASDTQTPLGNAVREWKVWVVASESG